MSKLQQSKLYAVAWWTIESIALLAMLAGASMFAPLGRKNRYIEPESAIELAVPLAIVALIALILIAAIPVPGSAVKHGAGVLANVTGIVVLLLLGYRLAVGADDARGFSEGDLTPGLSLLWLACVPFAVVVIRLEIIRRRDNTAKRWRGNRNAHRRR